ncbi:glycerate kinase [Rhodocytophaga rosea]|uniref:Glycerate kinase n=1 Tax=Rhodocytophaga rosea TaxID=2704465 RepID=A0A6C0GJV0_9BACT|nr:glycerate kinase [Rhodocytophaga rosea]QHT68308.1 glycerate kinase [Rhodocytophaga rosea]
MTNNQSLYYRKAAEEIFRYALESVEPEKLVYKAVSRKGNRLYIQHQEIDLTQLNRIIVIGAGKATAPMAQAIEEIMGDIIDSGLIIVKHGHSVPLIKIQTIEAGHPVPDENGISGTQQLLQLVKETKPNDLIIILISGGGSALLIDLPQHCILEELQTCFDLLLKSGASITEINTVRKHLSHVKGGGLARQIFPARLFTLILSDVIGDPLDVIASGPTVPDPTTFADAWSIVQKYGLEDKIPYSIHYHLQQGIAGNLPETPKSGDAIFSRVNNYIIGSNSIALEAARQKATEMGFHAVITGLNIEGEAAIAAKELVSTARKAGIDTTIPKPACLLSGGETTVRVQGTGVGGRNQELALAAALELEANEPIVILSAGTDGTDGPTDAAGAVVDSNTMIKAATKGLDEKDFLANNDSYHFFRQAGGHIITGPTRTNVMDIMMALIY